MCKENKIIEEFFMISSKYLTFEFQRYDLRNKPLDIYQKTSISSIIAMKKFVFARYSLLMSDYSWNEGAQDMWKNILDVLWQVVGQSANLVSSALTR